MRRLLYFKLTKKRFFFSLAVLLLISTLALGVYELESDELETAAISNQPTDPPKGKVHLVINVQTRTLEVYENEQLFKKYRVAVGKSETPTPIGEWNVVWKDYGWGTGFGTRWMGLNVPWGIYGIHGTNKPWSIGRFASHGCIRMRNKDVEEVFEWVPLGTTVIIEGKKTKVARILKYKTAGPDVVSLQLKLKELGFLNSRADGLFGTITEQAVKNYQQAKGYEITGIVDKNLAAELGI